MMNRILALSLVALGGLGLTSNADASRYVPQGRAVPLSAATADPTHAATVMPGASITLGRCPRGGYPSDFHAYTPRGHALHASRYVPSRTTVIRYRSVDGRYSVVHNGVTWRNTGTRTVLVAQWCEEINVQNY